ncbi:hypothetical protein BPIT_34650 [Candidatus Brocadia pituitae]|nr:hypothetical protein BPIT_34650 [Candidatus Brocadia pituitae]
MLSLASGNEVTFHRQIILWNEGNEVEVWRRMIGGEGGICQWKLDTFKNNLDSNHRVFSVFGLLIQAATGALGGLGGIPLNRSG